MAFVNATYGAKMYKLLEKSKNIYILIPFIRKFVKPEEKFVFLYWLPFVLFNPKFYCLKTLQISHKENRNLCVYIK